MSDVPLPAPLPVVTVSTSTAHKSWPLLEEAIDTAEYISLDLELSGLGDRKQLYALSVEDRYKSLSDTANTHAIISMGVACFKVTSPNENTDSQVCTSHVFDVLLLRQDSYLVNPASLSFLITHGFDFNQQYAEGMPFHLASTADERDTSAHSLQGLFSRILHRRVPVIVHNGLIDLVFLYRSFYGPLPKTLSTFVADLSEMFPSGVYDTKNIAEVSVREPASYLEYIYHKCWRRNHRKTHHHHVAVEYCSTGAGQLIPLHPPPVASGNLCHTYSSHGYCRVMSTCPHSHNILHVLDCEESEQALKRRRRKRGRKRQINGGPRDGSLDTMFEEELLSAKKRLEDNGDHLSAPEGERSPLQETSANNSGSPCSADASAAHDREAGSRGDGATPLLQSGHRSGVDAFMTGYCFACYKMQIKDNCLKEMRNKISLGGKDYPLLLTKSNFSTTSAHHRAMAATHNQ